ncbi:MAG: FKBP-type peptidyl-prolyl cis-trans isomerase [Methanolinea sp.]|nr:FKBP-type peptidyl-prolyl cis-trans isomerase [Methanolinea sp.]
MAIQKGDFIRLSYTGRVEGSVFDTTDEETAKQANIHNPGAGYGPVTIRVGSRHVILGLDEALEGKEVGEEGEIEVPPEKAFGQHDPSLVEAFNKNAFREKPKKGAILKVPERGEGKVVDMIGNRVLVDFNHPLAGKTLAYRFRIEERVDDPVEKVKGLIRLFSGRDMGVTLDSSLLTIHLPPGIVFDRRWLMWRSRVIKESFDAIPSLEKIVLEEVFERPREEGTAE